MRGPAICTAGGQDHPCTPLPEVHTSILEAPLPVALHYVCLHFTGRNPTIEEMASWSILLVDVHVYMLFLYVLWVSG